MEYDFKSLEAKWQAYWEQNDTFKVEIAIKEKFYVLDMFPYPSGEGLHLGHVLCFTATDIIARYKKLCGFNVLHPMGFDAFGLPAEQFAIETGQHPEVTTKNNVANFKRQLKRLGFYYDWDREINTSSPDFYKWTQWIFIKLFNSWYNPESNKAEPIASLIKRIERDGEKTISAADWAKRSDVDREEILSRYRLAYLSDAWVNWCPSLGTVLANEEVVNGVSERGGYPVERRLMKQWSLRITSYADRLLDDISDLDWTDSIKDSQRNWIGKSSGMEIDFKFASVDRSVTVFSTRPETLFGVTFLVLAPENPLVTIIATSDQQSAVIDYLAYTKTRTDRERMSETKKVSGVFTGQYAIHPLTNAKIPVYTSDYVLSTYGTGAVMGVPAHDERDLLFASKFDLPIIEVIQGYNTDDEVLINSDFINALKPAEARKQISSYIEEQGLGKKKINFKIRDAVFGRQRYWGEPIPVFYQDGVPKTLDNSELPLILPEIDKYLPTIDGYPPLGRAENWAYLNKVTGDKYPYELTTMPGWAGSSWYFLRYLDPHNINKIVGTKELDYWNNVDVYLGGSEHTTGHLIYFRFFTKFLFDLGYLNFTEPAKKLINQGMILGRSNFVFRIKDTNTFVSYGLKETYDTTALHVDITLVQNDILNVEKFRQWRKDFANAEFILEDGLYRCSYEYEKMSKSKYNVVSPDTIVNQYGADTLRLYIMFIGPIELTKPWNSDGIGGVVRFLRKVWNLFYAEGTLIVEDREPSVRELEIINTAKKKIRDYLDNNSFNTCVSSLMICVNDLNEVNSHNRIILSQLLILLSPFAPYITEELWCGLGNTSSIIESSFPAIEEKYLTKKTFNYPVSINGKVRANIEVEADMEEDSMTRIALSHPIILKWTEGKQPRKIIFVKEKILNIVV